MRRAPGLDARHAGQPGAQMVALRIAHEHFGLVVGDARFELPVAADRAWARRRR